LILQDDGANDWWPERLPSDDADQDESPWSVNSDDEDCGSPGRWRGGWLDGWNGRRGGRLDRRRNGWRDSGLVGGRVGGWDETPSSSFHRTLPKTFVHWKKCCQWNYVPDGTKGWYTEVTNAIYHDIINGSSGSRSAPSSRPHRIVYSTELF